MSDPANTSSAHQSRLDEGRYGYDFVVALTQKSVNATMKEYLFKLSKDAVTSRYIETVVPEGDPKPKIDATAFINNELGFNPFDAAVIPDGSMAGKGNAKADKLLDSNFSFGIEMTMGLPKLRPGQSLPPIVDFTQGISKVVYTMTFAHIAIVTVDFDRIKRGLVVRRYEQTPGHPWEFQVLVNLDLSAINQRDLPDDVRKQIKDCAGDLAFGVQQLLFDLNSARLQSSPTQLDSMDRTSDAYDKARKYFVDEYLLNMEKQKSPVLSYVVKQTQSNATYIPTDLALAASPVVGANGDPIPITSLTDAEKGTNTLDYLCVINNHRLPPTVAPTWNWINPDESKQSHGVIAIKHSTFMSWISTTLIDQAKSHCTWPLANSHAKAVNLYTDPVQWSKDNDGKSANQMNVDQSVRDFPQFQLPWMSHLPVNKRKFMLTASFEQADSGLNGSSHDPICAIDIKWTYNMFVTFCPGEDNFSVTQQMQVHMRYQVLSTTEEGNIVDRVQTSTVKFAARDNGELLVQIDNNLTNNDQHLNTNSANDFFLHMNGNITDIENKVKLGVPDMTLHVDKLRGFVFPGGKVFSFKKVEWADSGDLLTYITYADPSIDVVSA